MALVGEKIVAHKVDFCIVCGHKQMNARTNAHTHSQTHPLTHTNTHTNTHSHAYAQYENSKTPIPRVHTRILKSTSNRKIIYTHTNIHIHTTH